MSSHLTKSLLAAASALVVLAAGVTACSSGRSAVAGGTEKIKVVASTNVWGSVLAAVGGEEVQVTSVIHDPAADPHSYETTAADALAVRDAELTLANGGGYDDFFTKLSAQASSPRKLVAYDIAATGDENEHVWYSLPGVEKVAAQIATQLSELRPASKQVFAANASAFTAKADELFKKVAQVGATHPGGKVLATEPVAHYLLVAARASDVTPAELSKAVEGETDVPAAAVNEVKQLIGGKQVKAVVNNTQTVTPVTEQIVGDAKAAGIAVVDVTETFPAGVTDYIDWMSREADALAGALSS